MEENNKQDSQPSELESLVAKVLAEIPTGIEMVRLGPRPLFIEFCGTPKSGKTTCAERLAKFLSRNGFQVLTVTERAGICPLRNKHHMTFNVWTACASLNQILEAVEKDYQIVILDRGIFDTLCWMNFMEIVGRITEVEKHTIFSFLLLDRWRALLDIIFLMVTTPSKALYREYQDQLTQKEGSIMNERTLSLFNKAIDSTYDTMAKYFKSIIKIDTTDLTPLEGVKRVTQESLQALHQLLDEKIMVIDRDLLKSFDFGNGLISAEDTLQELLEIVEQKYRFLRRPEAEINQELIQIIPCAVIEYDKKILLLRRKERNSRDRLHNKYAIWVGGHARQQDKVDGGKIIQTALERELNEELFIRTSQKETLIAFLYDQSQSRSAMHVGVAYRVEVNSPDVSLAIDQQEFKEKKGLSVSGRFFSPEEIVTQYYSELEPWSRFLLLHFYKVSPSEENKEQQSKLW